LFSQADCTKHYDLKYSDRFSGDPRGRSGAKGGRKAKASGSESESAASAAAAGIQLGCPMADAEEEDSPTA
jgi:hypothetical protein